MSTYFLVMCHIYCCFPMILWTQLSLKLCSQTIWLLLVKGFRAKGMMWWKTPHQTHIRMRNKALRLHCTLLNPCAPSHLCPLGKHLYNNDVLHIHISTHTAVHWSSWSLDLLHASLRASDISQSCSLGSISSCTEMWNRNSLVWSYITFLFNFRKLICINILLN